MARDHDPPLVATLAELARLELEPSEAARLGAEIETILGYIRSLQAVEVDGVPEYLSSEQIGSGARPDEARRGVEIEFDRELALAGVPVRRGSLVAVPKFKD